MLRQPGEGVDHRNGGKLPSQRTLGRESCSMPWVPGEEQPNGRRRTLGVGGLIA